MAEEGKTGKQKKVQTVTDEQIVTVNKFPRRSFLTATGALLAGAVAVAAGVRASAQQDPDTKKPADQDAADKKKGSDPDSKKPNDHDKTDVKRKIRKMKAKVKSKLDDHDETDKKKKTDPDKKPTDPDGARR